jgi:transposase-like protein
MNIHENARLTPLGREQLVRLVLSGQTPKAAARAAGVCPRTARKWVERYRQEGLAGLRDRSSRPHRLYRPTPQAIVQQVEQLRRQRCTGQQIAIELGISRRPLSVASCGAWGSTGSGPWNRPSRCAATSAPIPAN